MIAYNRWQEARVRRRTEGAFAATARRDALLGGEADTAAAPPRTRARATAASAQVDRTIEHTLVVDAPSPPPPRDEPADARVTAAGLDPKVDYIVELDCAQPVTGAELARHAQALLGRGAGATGALGGLRRSARSLASGRPASGRYPRLRVGMQLTSRAGPLSDDDLARVRAATSQELALAIAAQADFPDTEAAVARAQELDRFCAEVDVQIGLTSSAASRTPSRAARCARSPRAPG